MSVQQLKEALVVFRISFLPGMYDKYLVISPRFFVSLYRR